MKKIKSTIYAIFLLVLIYGLYQREKFNDSREKKQLLIKIQIEKDKKQEDFSNTLSKLYLKLDLLNKRNLILVSVFPEKMGKNGIKNLFSIIKKEHYKYIDENKLSYFNTEYLFLKKGELIIHEIKEVEPSFIEVYKEVEKNFKSNLFEFDLKIDLRLKDFENKRELFYDLLDNLIYKMDKKKYSLIKSEHKGYYLILNFKKEKEEK